MRKNAAFNFIPELIGELAHTMGLSVNNPKAFYVETALGTLHTAVNVVTAFKEYKNTKRKKETMQAIKQKYDDLTDETTLNYQTEELQKLDIQYKKIKNKIQDEKFRDENVRKFIKCLQSELEKVMDILESAQKDPDYPERTKVEEVARKTLRDYKKLLNLHLGG